MQPFINGAFAFIGLGVIVAGITGLRLPPGDRLSGVLALAVGGGTGITAMALGTLIADTTRDSDAADEVVFFIASILGFAAVAISSVLAMRAASREPKQSSVDTPGT
jgi:uncharacterized membrane protein